MISKRYRIKLQQYQEFALEGCLCSCLDFSELAASEMLRYESRGGDHPGSSNGFLNGKRLLDWQVSFWRDELLKGLLTIRELRTDTSLPQEYVEAAIKGAFPSL